VGNVAAVELDTGDGTGGISPMLWSSGAAGLGMKMVLRTSRRPLSVEARFGGAACCCCVRLTFGTHRHTYCAKGVDQIRHGRIGIFPFFLNRCVPDIELELRRRTILRLGTAIALA
jgi:hypothetical protein